MKYVKQFCIIIVISFIGELLNYLIPLPIPGSIYGLVILFLALELRIIAVASIRETSRFLIEIMPIMFVPAGVGLLASYGYIKPVIVPVVVITLVSTIIVMVVSGLITQLIIRSGGNKKGHETGSNHIYVDDSGVEKRYIQEKELQ
jgi:holin-like protein